MPKAIYEDVTDDLVRRGAEVKGHYRVYRADDVLVKVRTLHDDSASAHGREVYRISGSIVGSDGKAVARDDGLAVHDQGHTLTLQSDQDVNLVVEIEKARFTVIEQTVRAERNYIAKTAITGVGSVADLATPLHTRAAPLQITAQKAPHDQIH